MQETTSVKREWTMPYEYFRDAHWRILEKTQPEMVDPESCYKALLSETPDGTKYLLNRKNRAYFKNNGNFRPPYYSADLLEDLYPEDSTAFVFCPGPSMGEVDLSLFDDQLTLAANSAGFKFHPTYWVMFESNFMIWFTQQNIPPNRVYIMTARCAIRWRDMYKKTERSRAIFVPRFEEMRTMPHRTPSVCTMGSICSAWWMGPKRIFIFGLDLSRPNKQPYVSGVPFSKDGATASFDDQLKAMAQFKLPDVQIISCSPHSRGKVPFDYMPYPEAMKIVRDLPPNKKSYPFNA